MTVLDATLELASRGRLYPSVILYGSDEPARQQAAVDLGRTLLCEHHSGCPDGEACTHCRRIEWPAKDSEHFHPDFRILQRDLRTTTSIGATRTFLQQAYRAPFEARGQVFVIAEADSLSDGAADALLKLLEEPPARTPRHFMLLAASRLDLLTTLRSRSLAVFLGAADQLDEQLVVGLAQAIEPILDSYFSAPSAVDLLLAADALGNIDGWHDPRARRPWATVAAAIVRYTEARGQLPTILRRRLLTLAEELLDARQWRLRAIPHGRILEGVLARHLA